MYYGNKQKASDKFFPVPNVIFNLGLEGGEILVYLYLMYCEDRKTFQCHPSYATIGSAVGMSNNTVKKYVDSLERKGFIFTEPTMVKTRDGRNHNGSLLYTIEPIKPIEEAYFQKQLARANARLMMNEALAKFDKKQERKKGEKLDEAVNV